MKSYKLISICILISVCGLAQNYTVLSDQIQNSTVYSLSLLKDSNNQAKDLLIKSNETLVAQVPVGTEVIGNSSYMVLKNSEDKSKILSAFGCNEAELNATFIPMYSGIITMLQDVAKSDESSLQVTVNPIPKPSVPMWYWFLLPIGLLLGWIGAKSTSKKTNASENKTKSPLKIDDEIWNEKKQSIDQDDWNNIEKDGWEPFLIKQFGITESDYKNYGNVRKAVIAKLQSLIDEKNKYRTETQSINSQQKQDQTYYEHIDTTYLQPVQNYFRANNFPNNEEPKQVLISNLLPLAIHFQSFIKIKTNKAMDFDKANYQLMLDGTSAVQFAKAPFVSNFADNTPIIASIIGILQDYHLDELKQVNVYNYKIEK